MRYALAVLLFVCGCGGEPEPYIVPMTLYCEGIADAYCSDEADCYTQPQMCETWDMHYNLCVSRYACLADVVVNDYCFWAIEGEDGACDAPAGVPSECPEVCP